LAVTHISQQALQTALSSKSRELMAATPTGPQCSRHRRVIQIFVHFPAVLLVLVSLRLLHPEEESLGSGLKLEHIDPPAGTLRHTLELTVVREDNQIIFHGPRRPVFPAEVNERVVRLLNVH
jgi:hypothetical protein